MKIPCVKSVCKNHQRSDFCLIYFYIKHASKIEDDLIWSFFISPKMYVFSGFLSSGSYLCFAYLLHAFSHPFPPSWMAYWELHRSFVPSSIAFWWSLASAMDDGCRHCLLAGLTRHVDYSCIIIYDKLQFYTRQQWLPFNPPELMFVALRTRPFFASPFAGIPAWEKMQLRIECTKLEELGIFQNLPHCTHLGQVPLDYANPSKHRKAMWRTCSGI